MKRNALVLITIFIGLLGCVSNPEKPYTQASGIEINRDECIKKVRSSNSPFYLGKQCSLELSELIQLFLPLESGVALSWEVAADVNTPINWKTIGRSSGCDGTSESLSAPERCGEIFVTEKGLIDHTVLEKTVQPGIWTILLFGSNAGVNKVELNVEADITLDHLLDNLKQSNLKLNLIAKNDPWYGATMKENLYDLKVSGKQDAWLKEDMSCGVSGEHCTFTLTIFHNKDEAIKTLQYQNHDMKFGQ
ncbi:MAG: hypothetical protein PSU93_02005 [Methylobacter sp.]|uniref:Lipoprotein n=1 Tax=Candidatus Methylobacter titanis TaxID=3053457 RepID=A0AA43Q570_9GAMM|nr:hypothetical protein [Candidatus Methylobacter titanis]